MKKVVSIICGITGTLSVFLIPNDDAPIGVLLIWLVVGLASLYGLTWSTAKKETK